MVRACNPGARVTPLEEARRGRWWVMARDDLLVWIDLEMTGLDPERCAIVEIATIVTDAELSIVAEGPNIVIHQLPEVLATMDDFVVQMHQRSGLLDRIAASEVDVAAAEEATLAFVAEHCAPRTSPLCGNSIWKDRQFIERYMKRLDAHLHYRCVDVSTIKELGRRWYPDRFAPPAKNETHRALDDIRESIAELRWYRANLFAAPRR
jgi:oligoribonuclease